jgi:CDP-diglyceride synthetase
MSYIAVTLLLTVALFAGMVVMLEIGRRIGMRRIAADPEGAKSGTGALDGAVFALLGLLIAFTFSGATSRFDDRRNLIIEETNTVSTAYLRLDLLPASSQAALRELFRQYLDSRLETYQKLRDIEAARASYDRSMELQVAIWQHAVAAARLPEAPLAANTLLLPALNQMFDISTTRMAKMKMHPPLVIYAMLFGIALIAALLAGFGMAHSKSRSWVHIIGFTLTMALAVNVIINIEFPRKGLIRVDEFDQTLWDLRQSMNPG